MTINCAIIVKTWLNMQYYSVRTGSENKTGFRGFETERNPGFRKLAEI